MSRTKREVDALESISASLNKLTKSKNSILEQINARINEINELLQGGFIKYDSKISDELKQLYDMRAQVSQEIKKDEIRQEIKNYSLRKSYNKISLEKIYNRIYTEIITRFEKKEYLNKRGLYSIFKDTETMLALFEDLNLSTSPETIKTYQRALEDVWKIYKYEVQEQEREEKQRKKDKLLGDALFIGFFEGWTRLSKSMNKRGRR